MIASLLAKLQDTVLVWQSLKCADLRHRPMAKRAIYFEGIQRMLEEGSHPME